MAPDPQERAMTANGSPTGDKSDAIAPNPAGSPGAPLPAGQANPLQRDFVVPGARAALLLLVLINLFNYIDRQVLAANLTTIEKELLPAGGEDNKSRLGQLAMAFMVSYMVFAPLFGWLAAQLPRWKLIGIGVIVWSLASGASGLAGTFTLLLLTRCFVGIGEAAYGPIAPDVISDLYPVQRRGSVLAWFYVAIPVGSALGYSIGGALGYPMSFYGVVPPGILLGLACFFMPEPARGQTDLTNPAGTRSLRLADYLLLLKNPSYVLDTLGMTAMTFALGGIGYWMPYYIADFRKAGSLEQVNTIFGAIVVVMGLVATILGGLAGDWLRARFSGSYFLVSGLAMLIGFPLFLAVLWAPFPFAWVLIALACFCLFFNTGPTNTILANVTHPALRAQAFAVNIFIIHLLGDAISPTVIGMVADAHLVNGRADLDAGFLAVSGMILLGGLLWLAGERAPHSLDPR
jgi:MFS family permease